jgi:bifunctional non-homologous end joining protein LigD
MLQRTLPAGFITPCLPTKTDQLPSGGEWLHEIKHDGFRIIARKTSRGMPVIASTLNTRSRHQLLRAW